jgi:hypothetical protein
MSLSISMFFVAISKDAQAVMMYSQIYFMVSMFFGGLFLPVTPE